MGLFDKKYCDFCNEKIKFLCNRKLEDGNMCSDCAKAISPLLTDRRKTTVAEMKEHLQYREANKSRIQLLAGPEILGDGNTKLYFSKKADVFAVTSAKLANFTTANPDVIDMASVSNVETETKEHKEEIYYKDSEGNRKSYVPRRYKYSYDYVVRIYVNSPWFDEIEFNLNSSRVEQQNMVLSNKYSAMMNEINMRIGEAIRRDSKNSVRSNTNGVLHPNAKPSTVNAPAGIGTAYSTDSVPSLDEARQILSNFYNGQVITIDRIFEEVLRIENEKMSPWFNPRANNYFDQYLSSLVRVFDQNPTNQTIQLFILMIAGGMCTTTQRVWMETLYFVERSLNSGVNPKYIMDVFKNLGPLPSDPTQAKEYFRKHVEDYGRDISLRNMGRDIAQTSIVVSGNIPVQAVAATPQVQSPNTVSQWSCAVCGSTGNTGKFCSSCGAPRP
ncbi:MAG: DUF4428 domain-containing protein [Clostridia bacterium]|nr:DUF4428 domain-containing protein [Clostridia bacterium]